MEAWISISGGEQVLERNKAIGPALWWLISLSMYRLAQLSISDSSPPHCYCSAGLWVRTSGRNSLELEGISRQMRLCQPSQEHPPLPSAPDVITESGRGTQQFPAPPRERVLPWAQQGTALLLLGACWEPGSWACEQVPSPAPFLCR